MSRRSHRSFILSDQVVFDMIFKWTQPIFLFFLDYLPLEEKMILLLKQIEFALDKNALWQV